mgnify:FL=1
MRLFSCSLRAVSLFVAALALCRCFVAAKGEKVSAGAGTMDASALQGCLVNVHALDPEEKLLTLGSAWNAMSPNARLGFLQEIRRAERAEDVNDFTLIQIAAVESPEFSKAPVGCLSTALEVSVAVTMFLSNVTCCDTITVV